MVNHGRCLICKSGPDNCSCPGTCKNCLRAKTPQADCTCCQQCGKTEAECKDEECLRPAAEAGARVRGAQNHLPQQTINMKPPDIGMLRDKTNLQMYIHAQNQWARLSGTPRKQQADLIMWHASNTFPALYKEMVEHFGTSTRTRTRR